MQPAGYFFIIQLSNSRTVKSRSFTFSSSCVSTPHAVSISTVRQIRHHFLIPEKLPVRLLYHMWKKTISDQRSSLYSRS